jgi:hypothetical protein
MVPARPARMGASSQRAVVHLLSNGFAWAAPVTSIPPGKVPENVAEAVSAASVRASRLASPPFARSSILMAIVFLTSWLLKERGRRSQARSSAIPSWPVFVW